jgi:hypothetical protein
MDTINEVVREAAADASNDGFLIGTVSATDDTSGLNRVRITVPELFDKDNHPLATVSVYSPFGNGAGYGTYGTPQAGSIVKVLLQGGDPNYPIIESSLHTNVHPEFNTKDRWGYVDPKGNKLRVDLSTGEYLFLNADGVSGYTYDGQGNLSCTTKLRWTHTAKEIRLHADDTASLHSGQNTTIGSDGDVNVNGHSVNIGADGNVTIQGAKIYLQSGSAGPKELSRMALLVDGAKSTEPQWPQSQVYKDYLQGIYDGTGVDLVLIKAMTGTLDLNFDEYTTALQLPATATEAEVLSAIAADKAAVEAITPQFHNALRLQALQLALPESMFDRIRKGSGND